VSGGVLVSAAQVFQRNGASKMSFAILDVAFGEVPTPAVLRFLIRWTECLHGDGALRETLAEFGSLALADVVHLSRINTETGAQRAIATVDVGAGQAKRPLTRPHGLALVGRTLSRAKPGTVWSMSELDAGAAGGLERRTLDWMQERGFREAMLIPLSAAGERADVLEFYLATPLDRTRRAAIEALATAAAFAWGRQPEGRIARILRATPDIDARIVARRSAHPLSDSNPLGLTAAEFRICSLMQRETDLLTISKRLDIADSTLRTHLRSIFAKAGVAGQVGLVRLLLEPETARMPMRA
jgi:DNA-binding CsgD family transcriptional regulator